MVHKTIFDSRCSCLFTIFWFIKFRGIQKAIQITYQSHCLSSKSWKYFAFHQGQLLSLLEEVFKKVPMQPMQWCNICIIKSLNAVFILYIIIHIQLWALKWNMICSERARLTSQQFFLKQHNVPSLLQNIPTTAGIYES